MKRPKTDIRLRDKVTVRLDEGGSRVRGESLDGTLAVVLLESGKSLKVTAGELTNYSSAARKVWASTPNRRVFRPQSPLNDRSRPAQSLYDIIELLADQDFRCDREADAMESKDNPVNRGTSLKTRK